jgi:hypothetical protein|tara:strand:+ start:14567 stop:15364 length:798 start_codon:yes stop_codon:yes gene_type:complete
MKLSIFTSMTNPELRNDPYKEALLCYEDLADEVIVVGENWPEEFSFDLIGKVFQEGFEKSSGDWVIRMDLDYFFHEKNLKQIKGFLKTNSDAPAIAFPQYQFFTLDRYHVKTKLCIAMNKKKFPDIISKGGGDMCQPTLNNSQILASSVPQIKVPIWQYDSMFRTKEIISNDRARFARAWHSYFQDWGDRGGPTSDEAYEAWIEMIKKKYKKHALRMSLDNHPKYIKERLANLNPQQFGYNAFGLEDIISPEIIDYLRAYKGKYF